jgi:kinesin family member 15
VYQEMENLKKNYDKQIVVLNQLRAELPKDTLEETPGKEETPANVSPKYDASDISDQRWREEFEPLGINGSGEVSKGTDPNSWFLGYDRCNI